MIHSHPHVRHIWPTDPWIDQPTYCWPLATVATNLEYSGNSPNLKSSRKTQGSIREFCATLGKTCSEQNSVTRCGYWGATMLQIHLHMPWTPLGELTVLGQINIWQLVFVVITFGKISLWLWKNLEKSGKLLFLLCGHTDQDCFAVYSIVVDGSELLFDQRLHFTVRHTLAHTSGHILLTYRLTLWSTD